MRRDPGAAMRAPPARARKTAKRTGSELIACDVHQRLRRKILTLEFRPGARLVEDELSAAFDAGVLKYAPSRFSRSPSATHASANSRMPRFPVSSVPASTASNTPQSIAANSTALP